MRYLTLGGGELLAVALLSMAFGQPPRQPAVAPKEGPPTGSNWLKIGFPPLAHDRMFGGSEVLSGLQALIYDKPAKKEDGMLSVFDPNVLYRGREVRLNLDRLAPDLADALRR